jgi:hypothetical protein
MKLRGSGHRKHSLLHLHWSPSYGCLLIRGLSAMPSPFSDRRTSGVELPAWRCDVWRHRSSHGGNEVAEASD